MARTKTDKDISYTQKTQDCLIDTGKAVERSSALPTPTLGSIEVLYNNFIESAVNRNMKEMNRTSKALLAAIAKWRVEKL